MNRLRLAVFAIVPAVASAQTRMDVRVESVALLHKTSGAEAAVGLRQPIGPYLRVDANVGGAIWPEGDRRLPSPRAEVDFRFLLDPFAERKWGLSFAAGLGYVDNPYLMLAADIEGQPMGGWRPAFRIALGGGVRVGLVLRRAAPNRR